MFTHGMKFVLDDLYIEMGSWLLRRQGRDGMSQPFAHMLLIHTLLCSNMFDMYSVQHCKTADSGSLLHVQRIWQRSLQF